MNISKDKTALRKQMKAVRKEAQSEQKAKKIVDNLFCVEGFLQAESYFVYNSFGTEVPTMPVIVRLLQNGKEVYLPRVEDPDMVAVRYEKTTPMSVSSYGISEPMGVALEGGTDVVILPLLAATRKGERLGYGGGYYDRYLAKYPLAKKIGIAYHEQLIEDVFAQSHDIGLDVLVTDKQIITFEKK